jgi:hypothetical protein
MIDDQAVRSRSRRRRLGSAGNWNRRRASVARVEWVRLRRRDLVVVGAGLLVVAASFLPWWVVRMCGRGSCEVQTASAWRVSSLWSAAVVIAVVGVVAWLGWRLTRGEVPRMLHAGVLLASVVALSLTLVQWRIIPSSPPPPAPSKDGFVINAYRFVTHAEFVRGLMVRDHLRSRHDGGLDVDVGWGMWVGVAGMVLTALALIGAGRGEPAGRAVPDPSTDSPR